MPSCDTNVVSNCSVPWVLDGMVNWFHVMTAVLQAGVRWAEEELLVNASQCNRASRGWSVVLCGKCATPLFHTSMFPPAITIVICGGIQGRNV